MMTSTSIVDRVVFSPYYLRMMLAASQTFTVCCCTCCCAHVSSGTGRLL